MSIEVEHQYLASIQFSKMWTLYNFFVAMALSYLLSHMVQKLVAQA